MKQIALIAALVTFAATLSAAEPREEVQKAITKLQAQPNYSWTAKMEMPGGRFTPGPTKGQTEKGGFTLVSQEMGDTTTEAVLKGEKACVKTDDKWLLASELPEPEPGNFNRAAMMGRMLARIKPAAEDAGTLLGRVKELKAGDDGVYSGDLTEAGAKEMLTFGRGRPNAENAPPAPKNAKGSAKFWIKGGLLVKYESVVEGTVTMRDEDREVKRIRTVDIENVGKTKVEVPAEAKKKLSP